MPEVYRDLLTCVVCDKAGGDIKKCAKCFSVSYCGRECQVGDWARHKRLCVPVMVKDFGEKGRGLVASKKFSVGDLILKDKSVVCMSTSITPFECLEYEYAKQIYGQISKLSDADQKDYFVLSSNATADALLSKLGFWSVPEQHKRAVSIFLLNRIEGEKNDEAHLYLKLSLINHSCDPNSAWNSFDLDGKTVELRAIREIKANEEVTASYLESGIATFGERKEKEQKLAAWDFQCKCVICCQPEDDLIKKLRREWKELLSEMNMRAELNTCFDDCLKFTNALDKCVDFIFKVDKPYLSFDHFVFYWKLADMGLQCDRPDLHKKGMKLLKKHLFEDIDKFLLRCELTKRGFN